MCSLLLLNELITAVGPEDYGAQQDFGFANWEGFGKGLTSLLAGFSFCVDQAFELDTFTVAATFFELCIQQVFSRYDVIKLAYGFLIGSQVIAKQPVA